MMYMKEKKKRRTLAYTMKPSKYIQRKSNRDNIVNIKYNNIVTI